MNDLLHANIFFFITSVAVLAVTLMLGVALWYVLAILREVRAIAKNVRKASDNLERDLDYIRGEFRSGTGKVVSLFNTLVGAAMARLVRPTKRATPRKRPSSATEEDDSV